MDDMVKLLNALLLCMNLVLLAGALYFITTRGYVVSPGWSTVELVTVVLAALAILITVLGIFIAVIAIWGYARLSEDAKSVATAVAREHAGREAVRVANAEMQRRFGESGYGAGAAQGDGDSVSG